MTIPAIGHLECPECVDYYNELAEILSLAIQCRQSKRSDERARTGLWLRVLRRSQAAHHDHEIEMHGGMA